MENKSILSVGARSKLLRSFTKALIAEGFSADWTSEFSDAAQIIIKFPPSTIDLLCFGRGVTKLQKRAIFSAYKELNSSVRFIEGLAPITDLLIDQVKMATVLPSSKTISFNVHPDRLTVESSEPILVEIKIYRLNFLFSSSVRVVFTGERKAGQYYFPLERKSGEEFIVLSIDNQVRFVGER